ncbi:malonic semialdehyde reductase [Nocardia barduliensis]|uniref:malonic semialdehyde reductase n=1 Tax=Nocardia barduliensis TaxID=2736643 RepID=UPI001571A9F2|nr:malonic semialdehyde reductase [Nocardia barduliensis]
MTIPTVGGLDEQAASVLFSGARTANSFASTPVSDEELAAIWQHTRWAPTAANCQPMRVLFIRTAEARQRLIPHLDEGNQGKTRSAPATAILALDTEFHQRLPQLLPFRPEMREVFETNEELRTETARFNAALQAGYFILAVRACGLAAGPMAGFDNNGIDADFFVGTTWRSILVVNIGHAGPNPSFERLPRIDLHEAIDWA